jgi:hypothetical protein
MSNTNTIDITKVAFTVESLTRTADNVEAEILILETPYGKILQNLIESGVSHTYMVVGTGVVGEDGKVSKYELLGIMACSDDKVRG